MKDKRGRLQGTPAQFNINRANIRCCGREGQAGRNQEKLLTPQSKFPLIDKELRARLPPVGITCSPCCRGTQTSFCLRHQSTATAAAEEPRSNLLPASPAPQTPPLRDGATRLPVARHGGGKIHQNSSKRTCQPKIASHPPSSGAWFLRWELWVLSWVKSQPQCTSKGFPRISLTDGAGRKATAGSVLGPLLASLIAAGFETSQREVLMQLKSRAWHLGGAVPSL